MNKRPHQKTTDGALKNTAKGVGKQHTPKQPMWQRIILLCVLGYEALGCLAGGALLVIAPDGHLMDMPVAMMNGAFVDFLIPGIILFGLGILNTAAFVAVLRRMQQDWLVAGVALGGLAIWFWVEIAILLELHWLHAMWGLPVLIGGLAAIPLFPRQVLRKASFVCGILASVLYVVINIIVAMQWKEYDPLAQTVSELSAIGAPVKFLWIVLGTPYTFLMIAFSWGVWKTAGKNRHLRIAGILLFIYSLLGILWPFAPMHLREALARGEGSFTDTMHLALGSLTEIIYLFALGFAASAFGKAFRVYSVISFGVLLIFGILTFIDAPKLPLDQPTPFIGLWERINIGVFLLWVVVLAVIMLKAENRRGRG